MRLITILLLALLWQSQQSSPAKANTETLLKISHEVDDAIGAGHLDDAVRLIDSGLSIDSAWKEGLWKAGLILYQHNQFEAAGSYLQRLTHADPNSGGAWALEGMCQFQLHQFRETIDNIGRANRLGIPPVLGLARAASLDRVIAYIELEDFGNSIELLNKLVPGEDPEEREQLITLYGHASLQQSMYHSLMPGQAAVVLELGEARYASASGDHPRARALMEALIEKHPSEPMLHYTYGSLLLSWSDSDSAERQFRAELEVDPTSFAARLALAYVGRRTNHISQALPYAFAASTLKPDSYRAHLYLGQLLVAAGQLAKGCQEFEAARALSPDDAGIRYLLATTYRRLGRSEEAHRELEAFQKLKKMGNLKEP